MRLTGGAEQEIGKGPVDERMDAEIRILIGVAQDAFAFNERSQTEMSIHLALLCYAGR